MKEYTFVCDLCGHKQVFLLPYPPTIDSLDPNLCERCYKEGRGAPISCDERFVDVLRGDAK